MLSLQLHNIAGYLTGLLPLFAPLLFGISHHRCSQKLLPLRWHGTD